jgi:DNA (cytosine-5)-methyltransferase 1
VRLLDLFCGAGGAAEGYHRAGFEVVGVDINPQKNYPFEFIQADAMDFDLSGFDMIHASPPCQGYIQRNKNLVTKWPKLIEPIREKLIDSGLPYVIENVEGAPLIDPIRLCGTMFDLLLLRHRLFESNLPLSVDLQCDHWGTVADGDFAAVYAFGGKGRRHGRDAEGNRLRDPGSKPGPEWSVAMGIDWMTKKEMSEAIPPAYTEYIGRQLITILHS